MRGLLTGLLIGPCAAPAVIVTAMTTVISWSTLAKITIPERTTISLKADRAASLRAGDMRWSCRSAGTRYPPVEARTVYVHGRHWSIRTVFVWVTAGLSSSLLFLVVPDRRGDIIEGIFNPL